MILQRTGLGFSCLVSGSLPCDLPTSGDSCHCYILCCLGFLELSKKVYCRLSQDLGNSISSSSLLCVMPSFLCLILTLTACLLPHLSTCLVLQGSPHLLLLGREATYDKKGRDLTISAVGTCIITCRVGVIMSPHRVMKPRDL